MPNSRNIAYTNLDLGLHMDLLYSPFFSTNVACLNILEVLPTPTTLPDTPLSCKPGQGRAVHVR